MTTLRGQVFAELIEAEPRLLQLYTVEELSEHVRAALGDLRQLPHKLLLAAEDRKRNSD